MNLSNKVYTLKIKNKTIFIEDNKTKCRGGKVFSFKTIKPKIMLKKQIEKKQIELNDKMIVTMSVAEIVENGGYESINAKNKKESRKLIKQIKFLIFCATILSVIKKVILFIPKIFMCTVAFLIATIMIIADSIKEMVGIKTKQKWENKIQNFTNKTLKKVS